MITQCSEMTQRAEDGAFVSIVDSIREKALSRPDRLALSFLPDGKYENALNCSYAQLNIRAQAIAAAIQATGHSDGRPVLLMLPPGLEFIAAFFGCLYARAIAVPMTPPGLARMARTFNRLARIVEDSGSRVFITTTRLLKAVEELAERVQFAKSIRIVCLDDTDDALANAWQPLPLAADTPGWLQYTSGSTSSPKGVIVTHGNIIANLESIVRHMQLQEHIPTVSWLPPFHDMGLVGGILMPLHLGCQCVTMPPMAFLRQPACWLRAVTHYRAQLTGGPNFAYDLCSDRISDEQLRGLNLSSLSVCYCGSEPIRLKTIRRFLDRFCTVGLKPASFYPCYGLAENTLFTTGSWKDDSNFAAFLDRQEYAAGRIHFLQEQHPDAMPLLSCGTAGLNNDVRIVDPQTCREVSEKELGEIWIRGKCVAQGYWEQPETTDAILRATLVGAGEGTFLRTGDMGFMFHEHLFVSGRCKEMIILNGRNFFPQDLEECVLQNVTGLERNGAAAFGIDSDASEQLVMVFETRLPAAAYEETLTAIRRNLSEEFDLSPCAIVLCKRHGVPKTTSGKIQQSLCHQMYLRNELPVLAEWKNTSPAENSGWGCTLPPMRQSKTTSREAWENWLRDGLSSRLGLSSDSVGLHTPFSFLGMGSSTAVALTRELQQVCDRPLPATLFYDHADIASLASFMVGESFDEKPLPVPCAAPQAVAIIGMACRLPSANSPEALERLLFESRDAITRCDPAHREKIADPENGSQGVWGGFLDDIIGFDADLFGISPREAAEIDPQQRLLLEVSWQALERAGIAPDSLRHSRTGVFTGISSSDYENRRLQCGQDLNAYVGTGNAHSIAANRLSYFYGLEGPSMAVDSACSSSLLALHLACRSLRDGECETALVCGVNVLAGREGQDIFTDAHLMAQDGRCKAFSADADGYVRAEGCVVLVLKSLDRALHDHNPVLGTVCGSAVNQDGRSNGLTAPSRQAQARLLREALHNAGLKAADIDCIEAHGTGTPLGDPIEFGAISDVYAGSRGKRTPLLVSSIKTNIGHLEAAAGLAGVCRVLISLKAAAIPPHLHLKQLNPEITLESIPAAIPVTTTPWVKNQERPRRAGVSSFGFGGTNVHVIIEEAPQTAVVTATSPKPLKVLPLAAASKGQLRELAARYRVHLAQASEQELANVCLTCATSRAALPWRAALAGENIAHALEQLATGNPVPFMGHVPDSAPHRPVVFFLDSMTSCPSAATIMDVPPFASSRTALLDRLPSALKADSRGRDFVHLLAVTEAWRRMLGEPAAILCTPSTMPVAACLVGYLEPEEGLALHFALEGHGATFPAFKIRSPKASPASIPLFDLGCGRVISAAEIRDSSFWQAHVSAVEVPTEDHVRQQAHALTPSADIVVMRSGNVAKGSSAATPLLIPAFACDAAATPQHVAAVLACCWTRGTTVCWSAVHAGSSAQCVALPTYPFAHKRFWFTSADKDVCPAPAAAPAPLKVPEMQDSTKALLLAGCLDGSDTLSLLCREARAVLRLPEDSPFAPETPLIRAGFDSLLFMELAQRLSRHLGRMIPPALLMEAATLSSLLERLRQHAQAAPVSSDVMDIIACPEDRHLPFPLTDVQHAYWIGRNTGMTLGGVSCSNYVEADFIGLDIPRLENALDKLVQRHDMLRCIITPDGQQRVLPVLPACRIPLEDLSALPAAEKERGLLQTREQLSHKVLPADRPPLFEIAATRLDATTIRLHVKLDMLVADAYSFGIMIHDLAAWYADPKMKKSPLTLSFRDCVLTAASEKGTPAWQTDKNYWLQRLPSLPAGPELPLTQTPQSLGVPRFHRRTAVLDAVRWARLKALGREQGLTPSALLLAAFSLVLSRWTSQPHFCLMLTTFDRRYRHDEMGAVVGDFTSLLLLEVKREKGATFLEHALALGKQLVQDMGHSLFSAVDVLRELARAHGEDVASTRSAVVFTSALPLTGDDPFIPADSLGAKLVYAISQTPQVWLDHQVCEYRGQLVYTWDAVEELFPAGMLDALFAAYGDFLTALCADVELWQQPVPLREFPASQAGTRLTANATEAPIPTQTLFTPFLNHAAQDGAPAAFISEDGSLSRAETEALSRTLGIRLRSKGLRSDEIVAVMMEKGWEQAVAVMGILRAGGAYLPVSPSLPDKRIAYMFKDAGVRFCLVQPDLKAKAEACGGEAIPVIRAPQEETAGGIEALSDGAVSPESLAYIIYTSGSTGLPKGVMISHAAAHNTLADLGQRLDLGSSDRVIALASLSFDLSVFDLFGITAMGGAVVIPAPDHERDPAAWCRLMREQGVTVWNSTPSLMQLLLDYLDDHPDDRPEKLRLALLSGDWVPLNMPDRIHALWPNMTIAALGGATEAAIWSNIQIVNQVSADWYSIPYGRPLANQGYLVLDQDLCPCPDFVAGDLYITGAGLARGYLNDPSKTAAAFFRHPRSGQLLYRTGDLGRYWSDGTLEFLGRRDSQVKINGFRIELGEVERALNTLPDVGNAAVIALRGDKGDRLAGFVAPAPQAALSASEESPEARATRHQSMRKAGITLVDDVERLAYKQAGHNLRKDLNSLPRVPLAKEDREESLSLFSRRISSRRFAEKPMERDSFEKLLGCLRALDIPQWPVVRHRYGSAGWTYAVQTYVLVRTGRIRDLEGGCYYYHPLENALIRMADFPEDATSIFPDHNADIFASSAFALFLVADMDAIQPLYGNRSEEFVLIEAGLMSQLLEETAMEQQAGLCQIGALDFARLHSSFALKAKHRYLHCLVGGAVPRESDWDFTRALAESLPNQTYRGLSAADLQAQLRQWLPDYMVPQTLTVIDAIPLSANGKVDRKQLAELIGKPSAEAVCAHPEGAIEEQLAAIIRAILDKETVSVLDNFFELGATSLQLVLFQRRINELLHRQVVITDIFAHPNIRDLASFLTSQGGENSAADAMFMAERRAQLRRQMRRSGMGHTSTPQNVDPQDSLPDTGNNS